MIILSLDELKLTAESRNIKGYKNKSENDLIKILDEINLSKNKIKEMKKDFNKLRYGFSKSKINELRKSLTKKKKIFSYQNYKRPKKSS